MGLPRQHSLGDQMTTLERLAPQRVLIIDRDSGHGRYADVIRAIAHPPRTHSGPIKQEYTALELVTRYGSRWYGFERCWIGPDLRMHVAPINPRDEVVSKWELPEGGTK